MLTSKLVKLIIILLFLFSIQTPSYSSNRYLCPHRALKSFKDYNRREYSGFNHFAGRLDSAKTNSKWAYVSLTEEPIPSLNFDGMTIDETDLIKANFVTTHVKGENTYHSFWFREYNIGDIRHVGDNFESEGVDNFNQIKNSISPLRYVICKSNNTNGLPYSSNIRDIFEHNVLYIGQELEGYGFDLTTLLNNVELMFDRIQTESIRQPNFSSTLFVLNKNIDSSKSVIIFFEQESPGKINGHAFLFDKKDDVETIISTFASNLNSKNILISGDKVQVTSLTNYLEKKGVNAFIRGPDLHRDFRAIYQKPNILTMPLNKEKYILLNSIPKTKDEVFLAAGSEQNVENWKTFNNKARDSVFNIISSEIKTKNDLFKEISSGESSMLLIFAHKHSNSLIINGQAINLDEISSLQNNRKPTAGKRVCILIVCDSGDLPPGYAPWYSFIMGIFKKEENNKSKISLADLLIEKGFFDFVIAPDHEIDVEETIDVLKKINSGITPSELTKRNKGWYTHSELTKKPGAIYA